MFSALREQRKYICLMDNSVNCHLFYSFGLMPGIENLYMVDSTPEFACNAESVPFGGDAGIDPESLVIGPDAQDILAYGIHAHRKPVYPGHQARLRGTQDRSLHPRRMGRIQRY